MSAPQNFRAAFNGFNRDDVVNYISFMTSKHENQINQLRSEAEELRQELENRPAVNEELNEELEQLRAEVAQMKLALQERMRSSHSCSRLQRRNPRRLWQSSVCRNRSWRPIVGQNPQNAGQWNGWIRCSTRPMAFWGKSWSGFRRIQNMSTRSPNGFVRTWKHWKTQL